ncbi:MAG: hypothetical protein MUE85_05005 [Microscillaceae bacterium]|jgi:hypothetical protein|nr:hypothetical protein [Microscillaceae bacterium]
MKKIRYIVQLLAILLILMLFNQSSWAQCAMCKSVIENNASEGSNLAAGLNTGIIYLASMPYILFTFMVFIVYRSYKKNARQKQITGYSPN